MNTKLLKQKDFLLLIQGTLVSNIGTLMQEFALALYVLKITGSGAKFASVLAITLIPQLILGPFMGVFADRFDRKKIIVILDLMSGIAVGITAIIFKLNGALTLPYIYGLVILLSLISLLFSPAMGAILPSIIKKEELLDANSIKSVINSVGSIISPILAGFIFGLYGMFIVLVINSISFILSAISEMFINVPKSKVKHSKFSTKEFMNDFTTGLKFTASKRSILAIIFVALIANFALNPLCNVGFPYIVKNVFKCSDFQYGIFQGILLSGMLIGPFICTSFLKNVSFKKILTINIGIIGIVIGIVAAVVSPLYVSLFETSFIPYVTLILLSVVMVILISIINIFIGTMFQKEVPVDMMGRVGSVMNTLCMAIAPIGQILFGVLFDTQAVYVVVSIASLILIFSSFMYTRLTHIKDKDSDLDYSIEAEVEQG
jgi:MFS family permease